MNLRPGSMSLGWVLGSGRADLPDSAVDCVLTPTPSTDGVHGRHCRLKRDLETGVLMIISDGRKIAIDGKHELKRDRSNERQPPHQYQRALLGRTGISIGDLGYILEFTGLSQATQEEELAKARGLRSSAALFMSPTPANQLYSYFGYAVKPASYYGASSTVSYGLSESTGQPVVLKKIKRTSSSFRALEGEIKILRSLSHLIEVIDHSNRKHQKDYKQGECDEVTLVLAPPAPTTLAGIVQSWRHIANDPTPLLAQCIHQVASGLAYMHGQGVIHHDIKPDNIALVSTSPPKAVIIDLGHSEVARRSNNHYLGTIRYLAPEVMRVKTRGSSEYFSFPVDVWALGITLLELLIGKRIVSDLGAAENRAELNGYFRRTDRDNYDPAMASLWSLTRRMLAWEADKRITAVEVGRELEERFPAPETSRREEELTPTPTKRQKYR
ncbi:kinase-like domain-containing protein [Lophiotrema nucula]|uniref:Kinase-like domain-containing protein n=1 Tax=Lophiotrema nucula TaxID=690887 RepID=A0A6A5YR51_9PLEO|nr:kinase-like domain-containing protein [Lophiotrema nucula]